MFLKLTSATQELNGKPIVINSEHILSMLMDDVTKEDGTTQSKTFMFCPPHGTWEVQESIEEILALINANTK